MAEPKEWTLMFYFAGDNELAPVIVSQLKAIKDAGFQKATDVLVYFDPNAMGVPTRIYDVNRRRKAKANSRDTKVGDGRNPFVRNLNEDEIDLPAIKAAPKSATAALRRSLTTPDNLNAETALQNFLGFCHENHRAKRYMLFLVGHGMVVGNDAFLPDDNPVSAITLKKLGVILNKFTDDVKKQGSTFELLTLHSCSLSAIEVAYELKGTANYMMSSEGFAFVATWPYRQLLKRIFHSVKRASKKAREEAEGKGADPNQADIEPHLDIQALVEKLYSLTLFNTTDFMLSGYSHDLALCNLKPDKVEALSKPIQKLVSELKKGLNASGRKGNSLAAQRGGRIEELLLLAHWEAQSYWGESYTDLYDFCLCLSRRCDPQDSLHGACVEVMEKLEIRRSNVRDERFEPLVIHSENFGPESQYSRGLSIYFPWSRPLEATAKQPKPTGKEDDKKYKDEGKGVLERYEEYAFTKELGSNSWLSFLKTYFDKTQRRSRMKEDGRTLRVTRKSFNVGPNLFNPRGPFSRLSGDKPNPFLSGDKPNPFVGKSNTCLSIKNYPREPVEETITPRALKAFE
jgi:hypothetical protein